MTLKNELKKVLETLSEERLASMLEGESIPEERYQELQHLIANLNKTIRDLDERITGLATTQEEILYLLDQNAENAQEDIGYQDDIDSRENKYGLN